MRSLGHTEECTHSMKCILPPSLEISQTLLIPPTSLPPTTMIAIRPAITMKVWNVSVHTTARRPPCKWGTLYSDFLRVWEIFQFNYFCYVIGEIFILDLVPFCRNINYVGLVFENIIQYYKVFTKCMEH